MRTRAPEHWHCPRFGPAPAYDSTPAPPRAQAVNEKEFAVMLDTITPRENVRDLRCVAAETALAAPGLTLCQ